MRALPLLNQMHGLVNVRMRGLVLWHNKQLEIGYVIIDAFDNATSTFTLKIFDH